MSHFPLHPDELRNYREDANNCPRRVKNREMACYVCGIPTTFCCENCNKPICSAHSKIRYTGSVKMNRSIWRARQALLCSECGQRAIKLRIIYGLISAAIFAGIILDVKYLR